MNEIMMSLHFSHVCMYMYTHTYLTYTKQILNLINQSIYITKLEKIKNVNITYKKNLKYRYLKETFHLNSS